jgi:predicted amidohydrolase YtcJ
LGAGVGRKLSDTPTARHVREGPRVLRRSLRYAAGRSLWCATRNGGLAFDPEGNLGTLEVATLADLVLVDGDPLADVRVLRDHARLTVMKDGIWI